MRPVKTLLALVLTALMAAACYYPTPPPDDGWTVGDGSLDTTAFVRHHHYGPNFNFKVTADTLSLAPCRPGTARLDSWADTAVVRRGDKIVVADIALVPSDTTDSVWLKLARDQTTMGWTSERRLAEAAVPDDPISQFIHTFSGSRTRLALCIVGLMAAFFLVQAARRRHLHVVHFNDIDSFYPTLLCLTVSGAATLYGSLQHFVPETWVEFYYHPTLNPFGLPLVMSVFVVSVWLMGITALAVLDDVRRRLDWADDALLRRLPLPRGLLGFRHPQLRTPPHAALRLWALRRPPATPGTLPALRRAEPMKRGKKAARLADSTFFSFLCHTYLIHRHRKTNAYGVIQSRPIHHDPRLEVPAGVHPRTPRQP